MAGITVKIDNALLRRFERRAIKNWPREYGELLYGRYRGSVVQIVEMVRVPYLAGTGHFWYDYEKIATERESGKFLGTVHSHPDMLDERGESLPIPSQTDWSEAIKNEELVHGICHIRVPRKRPRASTHFYLGYPCVLNLKRT